MAEGPLFWIVQLKCHFQKRSAFSEDIKYWINFNFELHQILLFKFVFLLELLSKRQGGLILNNKAMGYNGTGGNFVDIPITFAFM